MEFGKEKEIGKWKVKYKIIIKLFYKLFKKWSDLSRPNLIGKVLAPKLILAEIQQNKSILYFVEWRNDCTRIYSCI